MEHNHNTSDNKTALCKACKQDIHPKASVCHQCGGFQTKTGLPSILNYFILTVLFAVLTPISIWQLNGQAEEHFSTLDHWASSVALREYEIENNIINPDSDDRIDIFNIYSISKRTSEIDTEIKENLHVLNDFWGCARRNYENCRGMTVSTDETGLIHATLNTPVSQAINAVLKNTILESYELDRRGHRFVRITYSDTGILTVNVKAPEIRMTHAYAFTPMRIPF
jgi:hypothetical protein